MRSAPSLDPARIQDPALRRIAEKLAAGERLDAADGLTLFRTPDLLTLGALADGVKRERYGDRVTFAAIEMPIPEPHTTRPRDPGLAATALPTAAPYDG